MARPALGSVARCSGVSQKETCCHKAVARGKQTKTLVASSGWLRRLYDMNDDALQHGRRRCRLRCQLCTDTVESQSSPSRVPVESTVESTVESHFLYTLS